MNRSWRFRRRSAFAGVAVVLAAATACGSGDERPAAAAWAETWEERQQLIPGAEEILNGAEDLCGERLGRLRIDLPDLRPTPSEAIDAALEDWISLAETIMFECPGDPTELDEQLQTLDALAAEVDAGLEAGTG